MLGPVEEEEAVEVLIGAIAVSPVVVGLCGVWFGCGDDMGVTATVEDVMELQ